MCVCVRVHIFAPGGQPQEKLTELSGLEKNESKKVCIRRAENVCYDFIILVHL